VVRRTLCNVQRCQNTAARRDTRARHSATCTLWPARSGYASRRFALRRLRLQSLNSTAGASVRVEEALIEMYLTGVSVRRAEDITAWSSKRYLNMELLKDRQIRSGDT
jgi:hypothetical protein